MSPASHDREQVIVNAMDWYWYEDGHPIGADEPTGMVHREDCWQFDTETWTWWAEVTRLTPRLIALLPRASYPDGPWCPTCLAAELQAEQLIKADREAARVAHLADRQQHAWHERGPVVAVMADRQALSGRSEQDLLVRDKPA